MAICKECGYKAWSGDDRRNHTLDTGHANWRPGLF